MISGDKTLQTSRLTKKFQATIPQTAREALGVTHGDRVAFEVENGRVLLRKVQPIDLKYLSAVAGTLSKWASEADEVAYRDL